MADDTFEPGAVVQLKSGGPKMTVVSFDEQETGSKRYYCRWFDGNKTTGDYFSGPELNSKD